MTVYDAGPDGELTPASRKFWHDRFNGFGIWIIPFTNVHPSGIGFESPNAFSEDHLENLKEYARISHEQGAKAVIQLAHAGVHADKSMTRGNGVWGQVSYHILVLVR